MGLTVENPNRVPAGGSFRARHAVSGTEFRGHTIDLVWKLYNDHSRANGYPEVNRQGIEENICKSTPADICIDTEAPPLHQRIRQFAGDMTQWARAGFPASKAAVEARLPICQVCPHWSGETGGSYFSVACRKCGCTSLKLAVHTSVCPDNPPRWGRYQA